MASINRLRGADVDGAIVHLPMGTASLDECIDWVEWFAKDIIPAFRT